MVSKHNVLLPCPELTYCDVKLGCCLVLFQKPREVVLKICCPEAVNPQLCENKQTNTYLSVKEWQL